MTPTRAAALEAAVASMRDWCITPLKHRTHGMHVRMCDMLDALDNIPAEPEPEGEMVEVRAGVYKNGPNIYSVMGMRFEDGQIVVTESDNLIATITARIPRPVVPEVVAEVVKP